MLKFEYFINQFFYMLLWYQKCSIFRISRLFYNSDHDIVFFDFFKILNFFSFQNLKIKLNSNIIYYIKVLGL